jgi:hypothetical protein
MFGYGTDEPWFYDKEASITAAHWRKPLRIDEVNRLADTPEVRERRGRP